MTTIAFDGKHIASDSQMTYGSQTFLINKLDIRPGYLIWFAGSCPYKDEYIKMIMGRKHDREFLEGHYDECEALVLKHIKGKPIELWAWGGKSGDIIEEPTAIGSGRDLAIASMYLGKSAEEAIKIASIFDSNTNDRIQLVDFATQQIVKVPSLNRFKDIKR